MRKSCRTAVLLVVVSALTSCSNPEGDLKKAEQINTEQGYADFIKRHPSSPLLNQAQNDLEKLVYEAAKRTGTSPGFESFLTRFPKSHLAKQAKADLDAMEYEQAKRTGDIPAYETFLHKYPGSTNAPTARNALCRLEYESAIKANDIAAYEAFLAKYADSDSPSDIKLRLNKQSEERDWSRALLDNSPDSYLSFSTSHPDSSRTRVVKGTLEASLSFGLGVGGGLSSPKVVLEMDKGKTLSIQISQEDAIKFKVVNYKPINDAVGTIGTKGPMVDSVVILAQDQTANSDSSSRVLAIRPGVETAAKSQ